MKKFARIRESYDGAFTEIYYDLYKDEEGFYVKGISFHYNAGKETILCDNRVPKELKSVQEIFEYVCKRYTASQKHIEDLREFINNNV